MTVSIFYNGTFKVVFEYVEKLEGYHVIDHWEVNAAEADEELSRLDGFVDVITAANAVREDELRRPVHWGDVKKIWKKFI